MADRWAPTASTWARLRDRAWWVQALLWVCTPPIPLGFWAASRPRHRRRPWWVATAVMAMAWLVVGASAGGGPGAGSAAPPSPPAVLGAAAEPPPGPGPVVAEPATTAALPATATAAGPVLRTDEVALWVDGPQRAEGWFGNATLAGRVDNVSGRHLATVVVHTHLLDAEGRRIGVGIDAVFDLPAGGTAAWSINTYWAPDVARADVDVEVRPA